MPADRNGEDGVTLVEMAVVMLVLGIVLAMAFTALLKMQKDTNKALAYTNATEQSRLALAQIDRQVRSGNVLYDPATEATYVPKSLRIYTQANGAQRCVQWRVADDKLETRSWTTTWATDDSVTDWRTVAVGIVNTTTPFSLQSGNDFGARLLNVTLLTQAADSGRAVEVTSSLAGRNTQYYDRTVDVCGKPAP